MESDSSSDNSSVVEENEMSFDDEEKEHGEDIKIDEPDVLYENWKHISAEKYLNAQRNETMPSPKIPIDESLNDPYTLFCHFFPDELMEMIASQTNRYYRQFMEENPNYTTEHKSSNIDRWQDMTVQTTRAYLAIIFLMGIIPRSYVEDHWRANALLKSVVAQHIQKGRFYMIWRFLHLNDNR